MLFTLLIAVALGAVEDFDAAWLRFEGTPDEVERNHRAYFEQGYTTFQVQIDTDDFNASLFKP